MTNEPEARQHARALLAEFDHDVTRVLQLCAYEQYLAEAMNDADAYQAWHRITIALSRAVAKVQR